MNLQKFPLRNGVKERLRRHMVQDAASQSSIVTATDSSELVRTGLCEFVFLWSLALLYLY